jgi:hypothetical protein
MAGAKTCSQVRLLLALFCLLTKRTGSRQVEGYNNRLFTLLPSVPLAVDKMVNFLVNEDAYWCNLINTPALWSKRKIQIALAKIQHLKAQSTAANLLGHKDVKRYGNQLNDASNLLEGEDDIDLVDQHPLPLKVPATPVTSMPGLRNTFVFILKVLMK